MRGRIGDRAAMAVADGTPRTEKTDSPPPIRTDSGNG
jgi:hypothetical protein